MLKQIDKTKSIETNKVLGTEILNDVETNRFNVLFGQELQQNKMAISLDRGWSYYKGIIACVDFKTMEEAQNYANKIMNTNLDYNDYLKHKEAKNGQDNS